MVVLMKRHLNEKKRVKKLNLAVGDLFDTSRSWLLVDNGSLLGYFDFVSHVH